MDLEVVGRHALLFDDDATSAFVNSDDALVEWNSLKIDRFDVRHLLTSPPPPRRRGRGGGSDDLEEEINRERYLDLPSQSDQEDAEESENRPETVGFHAVGFSYGDTDDSSNLKNNNSGIETSGFTPPFPVPEHLLQCLPPSEKLHQIIARTATFVSKHGGQSEIVLRVKQGDNPTFGFLMPGHDLHPYFRYLVDHSEFSHSEREGNIRDEGKRNDNENNHSNSVGGALSLLGSVYDSGEEEDGDNHAKTEKHVSDDSSNGTILHGLKKIESGSRTHVVKDESESQTVVHADKEKVFKVRKNMSVIESKSVSSKVIEEQSTSSNAAGDKTKTSDAGAEPLIFEPPSEMKTLISKLAEFVARNGKQFEANLIEQDVKHGRFPFLLQANKYHAYYLKILQDAQEPKINGKSSYSGKDDSVGRGKESDPLDMPVESDRKEKFKMVIGKSKKDAQETEPKETQKDSGITIDAASAAAILQAATRGIKPSNLDIFRTASGARDSSEKSGQSGSAEASKSITREASVEVDSSEAQLTAEQKRKAERLKRAKMFVAMLKSGNVPFKAGNSRGSSMESHENEVSKCEKNRDNVDGKERESILVSADVDKPATVEKPEMNYFSEEHNIPSSKRKYRTRSEACEDDVNDGYMKEHDERHRRRKHRSKSKRVEKIGR